MIKRRWASWMLMGLCLVAARAAAAQNRSTQISRPETLETTFSYQGRLTDAGNPANATYDMQFKLFDTPDVGGGVQQGSTITNGSVPVTNGSFSVALDFGAAVFNGSGRYLEIGVRLAGSPNPYTLLSPRQPIFPTPYAIRGMVATAADGLTVACINCVTSSQIASVSGSAVTGTIPVASVPDLSASYIKNTTSQQASANFNISGNGTIAGNLTVSGAFSLNTINAQTQYNLAGARILSNPGINNLFAGVNAGAANTSGCCSTFFGFNAGALSNASDNSFFGNNAGASNTSGNRNSFFGSAAGFSNINGVGNSFFGINAGRSNPSGNNNSFFGDSAGFTNIGLGNSFYGASAGFRNHAGSLNSVFGFNAGSRTDDGSFNSFFGNGAGQTNTTGTNNTIIGSLSDVGSDNLTNAAAIGANAFVQGSNSLVLGSINGVNGATASVNVGIGITIPLGRLHVSGGTALFDGNVGIGIQTPNAAKLVVRDTSIGTAVFGTTSTNGSGVLGQSTGASGYGVYGLNNAGGYAMYADGNAGQARNKGGWVKAMALISQTQEVNPIIVRCYNSQFPDGGASLPTCGFTVSSNFPRVVDFGFQVNDRFILVTPAWPNGTGGGGGVGSGPFQVLTAGTACTLCTNNQVSVSNDGGSYYIFIF